MNALTNVKNLNKINEKEIALGVAGSHTSWHAKYKDSAWIFVGGLPYDLTEGDVLCVFSQYGEIVNINMVRDKKTGKSKGYGFMCYEDQRSTILAVDNLNGFKLLGRTLRVDHVENYRQPKDTGEEDEITKQLREEGCAPKLEESASELKEEVHLPHKKEKKKKKKKEKKKKKDKKKYASESPSDSVSEEEQEDFSRKRQRKASESPVRMKKEKFDSGYDKYSRGANQGNDERGNRNYGRSSVVDDNRSRNRERYIELSPEDDRNELRYRDDRRSDSRLVKSENVSEERYYDSGRRNEDRYQSRENDRYQSRENDERSRSSFKREHNDYAVDKRDRRYPDDRDDYDRWDRHENRERYKRDRERDRRRSRSRSRSPDRYHDRR